MARRPFGALWGQMIAKAELVEYCCRVGGQKSAAACGPNRASTGGNQPTHDMGVTVAEVFQLGSIGLAAVDMPGEPDLTDAALHLLADECSASGIGSSIRPSSMTYR